LKGEESLKRKKRGKAEVMSGDITDEDPFVFPINLGGLKKKKIWGWKTSRGEPRL